MGVPPLGVFPRLCGSRGWFPRALLSAPLAAVSCCFFYPLEPLGLGPSVSVGPVTTSGGQVCVPGAPPPAQQMLSNCPKLQVPTHSHMLTCYVTTGVSL